MGRLRLRGGRRTLGPQARQPLPYVPSRGGGPALFAGEGTGSRPRAQLTAYGFVSTLFAVTSTLAWDTSAVPWGLFQKRDGAGRRLRGGQDRRENTTHAAALWWAQPNPHQTRQEFVEYQQLHCDLAGESFWVTSDTPLRSLTGPVETWLYRPDRMAPRTSNVNYLDGWEYTDPDGRTHYMPSDRVIHPMRPSPLDPYRGMAPAQTLLTRMGLMREAELYAHMLFENGAMPGAVLEVGADSPLHDRELDALARHIDEQHRGVRNAGRTLIMEMGKWVPQAHTMRDSQYAELDAVNAGVVMAAYAFPKFKLGQVDDVNRATAEASLDMYALTCLVPRLERIKQVLNTEMLPQFGATATGWEFDYESPVRGDRAGDDAHLTAQLTQYKAARDAGATHEAACELAGLEVFDVEPPKPVPAALRGLPPAPDQDDDDEEGQAA